MSGTQSRQPDNLRSSQEKMTHFLLVFDVPALMKYRHTRHTRVTFLV